MTVFFTSQYRKKNDNNGQKNRSLSCSSIMFTVSSLSLTVRSFAKLNCGLEVLHKRADGFHAINTVFMRISLHDTLTLELAPHDSTSSFDSSLASTTVHVHCEPELGIPAEQNIAFKAAQMLLEHPSAHQRFDKHDAVSITIHKRIPTGGGLGGGSSNAAHTLLALNNLLGNPLSQPELLQIAACVGSDVPFFILDTPCSVGTSRGEVLQPLDVRLPYWIVLVCSGIHVATPWAYKALARTQDSSRPASDFAAICTADHLADAAWLHEHIVNDFESVVFAEHPFLATLKERLYDAGAVFAQMSGSGSTLFGFFTSEEAAHTAQQRFSDTQAIVCQPV